MPNYTNAPIEQDEVGYYVYMPVPETGQVQDESLEEVLPDIWAAVNHYLETISEEAIFA